MGVESEIISCVYPSTQTPPMFAWRGIFFFLERKEIELAPGKLSETCESGFFFLKKKSTVQPSWKLIT